MREGRREGSKRGPGDARRPCSSPSSLHGSSKRRAPAMSSDSEAAPQYTAALAQTAKALPTISSALDAAACLETGKQLDGRVIIITGAFPLHQRGRDSLVQGHAS